MSGPDPFYTAWEGVLAECADDLDLSQSDDRALFRTAFGKASENTLVRAALRPLARYLGGQPLPRNCSRKQATDSITQAWIDRALAAGTGAE